MTLPPTAAGEPMALFSNRLRSTDTGPTYGELYVYLNRLLDICEAAPEEIRDQTIPRIDHLHQSVFQGRGGGDVALRTLGQRFATTNSLGTVMRRLPAQLNGFPWSAEMSAMREALGCHP